MAPSKTCQTCCKTSKVSRSLHVKLLKTWATAISLVMTPTTLKMMKQTTATAHLKTPKSLIALARMMTLVRRRPRPTLSKAKNSNRMLRSHQFSLMMLLTKTWAKRPKCPKARPLLSHRRRSPSLMQIPFTRLGRQSTTKKSAPKILPNLPSWKDCALILTSSLTL